MCAHSFEDYSPEEEICKLRTQQKEDARRRREQAERWMRSRRNP
jgi:hypothetical protein